ncbi:MAG: vWA domain-containing protein [bacterium]
MQQNNFILTNSASVSVSSLKNNISALKEAKKSIVDKKQNQRTESKILLLLDISGSMNDDCSGNKKIDSLASIVKKMPLARKIYFNNSVYDCGININVPEANGGTDLALAFKFIKENNINTGMKLILVSDGEPNIEIESIAEALKLNQHIYIIYIGEKYSSGEKFMKKLAEITGGSETTISEKTQNLNIQLNNAINLLLT